VYLWQLFGASNQLMAALSLLIVTVWLASTGRNPSFAGVPMVFMYVTTIAATGVTAYNLYKSIVLSDTAGGVAVFGAWLMIAFSILLVVAAIIIAIDGYRAYGRFRAAPAEPAPVTT
jgi:carbon starvation protein